VYRDTRRSALGVSQCATCGMELIVVLEWAPRATPNHGFRNQFDPDFRCHTSIAATPAASPPRRLAATDASGIVCFVNCGAL
jgi:hypothetical protein